MSRIAPIVPAEAPAAVQAALDQVRRTLGVVPNLVGTLARAPAALDAYLGFGAALQKGRLSAKLRESVALAVAGANACVYCASAHSAVGAKLGIAPSELKANVLGQSSDPKTKAALEFAKAVVATRGRVSDAQLKTVKAAGFDEAEVLELVADVVLNIFTNYVNHVAQTDVDFPVVSLASAA